MILIYRRKELTNLNKTNKMKMADKIESGYYHRTSRANTESITAEYNRELQDGEDYYAYLITTNQI